MPATPDAYLLSSIGQINYKITSIYRVRRIDPKLFLLALHSIAYFLCPVAVQ